MAAIETSKATDTGYTLVTLLNYDLYQGSGEDMKALHSGIPSAIETPFEPASNQHPTATINKGNKGKTTTPSASDLTLAEYLEKFSSEGQEVLRQTVSAIRSTRKCGKVAQSVLDSLARKLDRYPGQVVRQACQAYLARNYASQGKAESYLLGIVRGEAKRQSGNGRNLSGTTTPPGRSTGPVDTCGRPLPYIGRPRQEDEHE
jgi:predicted transcriptional regulator